MTAHGAMDYLGVVALHPLEAAYQERVPPWLRVLPLARGLGLPQTLALLEAVERDTRFTTIVRHLGLVVNATGLEHLDEDGPLVIAANHPFAMVDLSCIGAMVEARRPGRPVRVAVDEASRTLTALHPLMCFVGTDAAGRSAFWDEALELLGRDGTLIIFPAGQSNFRDADGVVRETRWHAGALKAAARSGATLIPAFVDTRTSLPYSFLRRHFARELVQLLNLSEVHRLRAPVGVRFGAPLRVEDLDPDRLRSAVYALGDTPFRVR